MGCGIGERCRSLLVNGLPRWPHITPAALCDDRDAYPLFEDEAVDVLLPPYELTCLVPMQVFASLASEIYLPPADVWPTDRRTLRSARAPPSLCLARTPRAAAARRVTTSAALAPRRCSCPLARRSHSTTGRETPACARPCTSARIAALRLPSAVQLQPVPPAPCPIGHPSPPERSGANTSSTSALIPSLPRATPTPTPTQVAPRATQSRRGVPACALRHRGPACVA